MTISTLLMELKGAALLPVFLTVAVSLGISPLMSAAAFIICGNYFGSLTQYANGCNPILFGAGYVPVKTWYKTAFICSLVNMFILFVFGFGWWKILGLF